MYLLDCHRWRRGSGSDAASAKAVVMFLSVNENTAMKRVDTTGEGGGKLDVELSKYIYHISCLDLVTSN